MANKPTPAPQSKEVVIEMEAVEQSKVAANALALAHREQNERVTALALQLNYSGSTDLGVLENSAREAIRRIGMTVFELGGYLLMLREGCEHGKFLPVLERLNLAPRAAQHYMLVARRFANTKSISHLADAGIAKLVELIALDNEQLEDLTELGQTGELALDNVSRMSVKELRKAVREAVAEREATDKLLENKNKQIDKLSRHVAKVTPDQVLIELQKEATGFTNESLTCVQGQLRQAFIAIKAHSTADHSLFMAGLVGLVQAQLAALREEFNLPDISNARDQELAAEMAQWMPKKD